MWPFTSERKEALKQFSRFVAPDVIEEILAHPEEEYPKPRSMFIGFMVIQVIDDDTERLNQLVPQIIEVIQQHQSTMNGITISLITAMFGAPVPTQANPSQTCQAVAQQLVQSFPHEVKVAYGSGTALIGSWGRADYFCYGPMFPSFSRHLEKLCSLNYGDCAEINW